MGWYDRKVRRVRDLSCGDTRVFLELEVRRLDCRHCGKVKRERLEFLADNPLYTKRFAYYVGRRCRSAVPDLIGDQGRGGGIEAGLAHGQGARPAVYGSSAKACPPAFPAADRH